VSKKKTKTDTQTSIDRSFDLTEAYGNKIRILIVLVLRIYRELSLAEIENLLNRTKPTIIRHINILIGHELVKSYYANDSLFHKGETQPGNIKRKYYSLTEKSSQTTSLLKGVEHLNDPQKLTDLIVLSGDTVNTFYLFLGNIFNMIENYTQKIKQEAETTNDVKILKSLLFEKFPFLSIRLFTDDQYMKFKEIYNEFASELNEILEEEPDSTSQRPFMYIDARIPIKSLIDSEGKL
jgi:hypothetical protein